MSDDGAEINDAAIPIPEEWDDLSDDAKDEVTAEVLKRVADETGVERATSETEGETESEGERSRPPRTFQVPEPTETGDG